MAKKKDPAAVKLGRKGGKEIAKREREYFRQAQARREKRQQTQTHADLTHIVSGRSKERKAPSPVERPAAQAAPSVGKLGQPKCGMHAFRRFRNTYLRSYTSTPPGVRKFWMGHAGEGMSDLYDKIRNDLPFCKEVAEKAGLGFELPFKKCVKPKQSWSKKRSIGPNGPKRQMHNWMQVWDN